MTKADTLHCLNKISRESDYQSFKVLYGYYFVRLFRFCMSIVHNKESAEEIVNDVFINLWRRRTHLYKIENPDVYLYVAIKNHSLDYLSKDHLKEMVDISTVSGESIRFTLDPEQLMITEEMKKKISHAVDQLPPRCKLIFKLIKEDGLKYKEVASILDISIKTVEAQLAISMKKLAVALLVSSPKKMKQKSDGMSE